MFSINKKFALMTFMSAVAVFTACKEDDAPPPSTVPPTEDCPTIETQFLSDGIEFECEIPLITVFGDDPEDANLSVIPEWAENPDQTGINPSEGVLKVEQTSGIQPWSGLFFDLGETIDFTDKQAISVMVYSTTVGENILLKLEDSQSEGATFKEVQRQTTVANEWEELNFTFSAGESNIYDRFVIFLGFGGTKDQNTVHYIDNIMLADAEDVVGPTPSNAVPAEAATEPTFFDNHVISLFSNSYTDVTVDTWRTDWSQSTFQDTTIAGNAVKQYRANNFVGIETITQQIDITDMTNLHMDLWTAQATQIRVKLVDFGADGAFDGGDDVEHEVSIDIDPFNQWEEWLTIDLPLSSFTGLTTQSNIAQLIISSSPSGSNVLHIDNILFYNNEATTAATSPTENAANVISIFSDAYTDITGVNTNPNWGQATVTTVETIGDDNVLRMEGLNYQGIGFEENVQDVSGKTTIHLDLYAVSSDVINFSIISSDGKETAYSINPTEGWNSIDIPLSEFTNVDLSLVHQFKFDDAGAGTSPTIYVDNIYFY